MFSLVVGEQRSRSELQASLANGFAMKAGTQEQPGEL